MNHEKLRKLRLERGETIRQVAIATGLTEGAVNMAEIGKTPNPRLKTVKALAEHYGVGIEEIV